MNKRGKGELRKLKWGENRKMQWEITKGELGRVKGS